MRILKKLEHYKMKNLLFSNLAKRSKIYDQKFNFKNFKKKFSKIIYINNLVKNEISKKLKI